MAYDTRACAHVQEVHRGSPNKWTTTEVDAYALRVDEGNDFPLSPVTDCGGYNCFLYFTNHVTPNNKTLLELFANVHKLLQERHGCCFPFYVRVSVWFCIFVPGSAGISYFLSWSHSDSLSLSLSLLLLLISFYIMRATNALAKSLFDAS